MKSGDGPPAYIHDEQSKMSDINFEYLLRDSALSCSENQSDALSDWLDHEGSLDCKIEELLYKPYAQRIWRPNEIKKYLDMMNPKNCFIIHQSKDYAEESDLQVEPIYETLYKKEAIAPTLLESWASAMPKDGERLDYPTVNTFVPDKMPKSMKAPRKDDEPIGKPVKLQRGED